MTYPIYSEFVIETDNVSRMTFKSYEVHLLNIEHRIREMHEPKTVNMTDYMCLSVRLLSASQLLT